jgi:hypothetical protein
LYDLVMGEVVDFTRRQLARAEKRKTERTLAVLGIASAAILGYFSGHSRGEDQYRQNQILVVPKPCFSFDRMQNGHLNIRLNGNKEGLALTVNGTNQSNEDLDSALGHTEPFELIC